MNAIKTIATVAILTAAVAAYAQDNRPYTGFAVEDGKTVSGTLFNSTGGDTAEATVIKAPVLGNIVLDTKGADLYSYQVDKVTLEFYTPVNSTGSIGFGFTETEKYTVGGKDYYRPTGTPIEGSTASWDITQGSGTVSFASITFDTPVELSYGLSYDVDATGKPFSGGFAFLVSSDIDEFGLNLSTSEDIKTLPFANTYNTVWTIKEGEYTGKDVEAPFAFKLEGTATQIGVVPEAGTISLALMGIVALGGFAGLRRFKRN